MCIRDRDKDEYLSNKNEKGSYDPVFYVPAEARWEAIAILSLIHIFGVRDGGTPESRIKDITADDVFI